MSGPPHPDLGDQDPDAIALGAARTIAHRTTLVEHDSPLAVRVETPHGIEGADLPTGGVPHRSRAQRQRTGREHLHDVGAPGKRGHGADEKGPPPRHDGLLPARHPSPIKEHRIERDIAPERHGVARRERPRKGAFGGDHLAGRWLLARRLGCDCYRGEHEREQHEVPVAHVDIP